jgi:uncharacterized membrane protein YphA (DoxX/SURF4 family)
MSHLPIPLAVIYAGLAGTLLALIVATIQNRWSLRVFFLLALRLAIGWHFLFEGLHKIHSHSVGPTETSRPFSSEPYFKVAPGPLGPYMRKQFGDPEAEIATKVKAPKEITPAAFNKLSAEEQAAECPPKVAEKLDPLEEKAQAAVDAMKAEGAKELEAANTKETKALKDIDAKLAEDLKKADTPFEQKAAESKAQAARDKAKSEAGDARKRAQTKADQYADGKALFIACKATYARWVYGAESRDTTVKGINGAVALTAPERLKHIEELREQVKATEERQATGLGNGYGTDAKRAAEWRMDLITAEAELARDANTFVADLQKALNSGSAVEEQVVEPRGKLMDKMTMWFLVVIGACIMAGLFTRVSCVLAAGFLVLTYLTFPPFPWFPLPPATEGNPVFINKNAIEALALVLIACYPSGRWLGLDALVLRPLCKYKCQQPAA